MELQKRNAGEENMGKDARAAYQVVLFSEDGRMKSQWLPKNREGIYYVGGESQNDCLLFLEGKGNCWVARCNKNVYFGIAREIEEQRITIENRVLYPLYAENKKYLFYMEKVTEKSYVFHHYLVKENTQLLIGRSISANIVYENAIVSKEHAILSYMGGNWYLEDIGSSNGVYLNDRRIARFKLKPMDRVYIWGLILIVGYGYLAINDEHEGVYITGENIRRTDVKNVGGLVAETGDGQELFDRKPRKQVGFPKKEIKLEAPPASMKNGDIPMMLRLGSSLAMGAGNMLSGNSMMMVSSVMFPFLNQKYTEKEREKYEELRTKKYTEYLREKRQEIQDEIRYEKKMRDEQFPRFEEILAIGMQGERLWERRNIDEDFLVLRLGTGDVPMEATIKYPEERFHLDDDELEDEMYGLAQGQYKIQNTAVNLSLVEHIVSGIAGEHEEVLCFAKILIMQTAVLHSYDEVKMIILADDADMEQLEFARFLPHMWDDQKNIRFMATKPGEAYQIGEVLKKEAEDDLSKNGDKLKEILKKRPFYLIFAFDKKLFDSMELLKTVVKKEENIGISTVALFPKLPKECTAICTLQGSGIHQVTYLREGDREADTFQMETFDERTAENVMHKLSNTSLMLISQEYALPKMVTFLEMYGVGRVEHLNPLNRWMESNPIQSLKSKKATWKSSNTAIATVSSTGLVTGKTPGTTIITASANAKTAKCTVTVKRIAKVDKKRMYAQYKRIVMNNIDWDCGGYGIFAFYDADRDDVPELYAENIRQSGDVVFNVYSFATNQLKKIGGLKEGCYLYSNPDGYGIVDTSMDTIGVYRVMKDHVTRVEFYDSSLMGEGWKKWLRGSRKYYNQKRVIPTAWDVGTAARC